VVAAYDQNLPKMWRRKQSGIRSLPELRRQTAGAGCRHNGAAAVLAAAVVFALGFLGAYTVGRRRGRILGAGEHGLVRRGRVLLEFTKRSGRRVGRHAPLVCKVAVSGAGANTSANTSAGYCTAKCS